MEGVSSNDPHGRLYLSCHEADVQSTNAHGRIETFNQTPTGQDGGAQPRPGLRLVPNGNCVPNTKTRSLNYRGYKRDSRRPKAARLNFSTLDFCEEKMNCRTSKRISSLDKSYDPADVQADFGFAETKV